MSPKDAAMNFVEANRSEKHRRHYRLALDDRGGVAPPNSGWIVHDGSLCLSIRDVSLLTSWQKSNVMDAEEVAVSRPLTLLPARVSSVLVLGRLVFNQWNFGLCW